MKKIELILSRLWHYFSSNALVFIMFLIGCTVCSVGFIFFYGNMSQTKAYEAGSDNSYSLRLYKMNFSDPISFDDVVNSELLKSELIGDVEVGCNIPEYKSEFNEIYKISSRLHNNNKIIARQGRTDFSDDELDGKENVVIVPDDDKSDLKIDNDITILT